MKKWVLFLGLVLAAFPAQASDCVLEKEKDGQKLFRCQAPGTTRSVQVLDLKGDFANTAYYHGLFLRSEIEVGVLKGVMTRAERAFSALPPKERQQIGLIKKCVLDNYKYSVSPDFRKGLRNLHRGLKDAGSKISWSEFEDANYMVEFSIFADSMTRSLSENPSAAKRKVFLSCAPYLIGHAILQPFKKLAEELRGLKMGCTGISVSASGTRDKALVHGRNFDTGLLGYYETHQIVVINRQKNGMISTGIASAGLHYAGGISGFNNQGLSVSLHELQTVGTRIRYESGSSDIAPYLLHSVLMKARTLNEAISIIQARKGFGAWTFFISDSKTDEVASIELSGDRVVVARKAQHKFLGQSNHFLARETSAEGYEFSPNKSLETRTRLSHVNRTMGEDFGSIDAQWVINRLSGHHDELVGPRSFGRTTTKIYTASTHVMLPARQEWWMSIGETYPTNRSHFIGFHLTPNRATPIEIIGVTKAEELPNREAWYDSMKYYVQSYLSYESDKSTQAGLEKTMDLMQQAQIKALQDGVFEFSYHFMWARLKVTHAARALLAKDQETALSDLEEALAKFSEIKNVADLSLHRYERAQLALWQFRAESLLPIKIQDEARQQEHKAQAKSLLREMIQELPTQVGLKHLKASLSESDQAAVVLDSEISIGTVE